MTGHAAPARSDSGLGSLRPLGLFVVFFVAAMSSTACSLFGGGRVSVPEYSARRFFETVSIRGGSISHDGTRVLVTSDASGVPNVYAQPVDGGPPIALTESTTSPITGVGWFPADDRVLVTADQEGNELNHLYVRKPNGMLVDLTPGENLKAQFVGWSADDRYFFVLTNERDPRYFDLYRYNIAAPTSESYARDLVLRNDDGYTIGPVSRDGRYVALISRHDNRDSDVLVQELSRPGSRPRLLTEHEGAIQNIAVTFTPDARRLLVASNEDSEWMRIWSYDVASGERELFIDTDWDVMQVAYSRNGEVRMVVTNEDARTVFRMYNVATNRPIELPEIGAGEILGARVSRDGNLVSLSVSTDTSPNNLFVWDRTTDQVTRLTNSLHPKIDEDHLVTSEIVRFESFDGLEIPAVLWKPHHASRRYPVRALVWVHGGPGGQSRTGYNAQIQYLVNHGYAVLAVNNRGSSGYGKTFFHADDRRHGDVDLADCVAGGEWLERQRWVQHERVGIIGGSYGGYMVVAALAFRPEAFAIGVDIFGVTNWLRTIESIPAWWESARKSLYAEMGDPATDRERLRAISPLFYADEIERPLLVIQGANDPRVLPVESEEIVEAVRKNRVPVEYLVFDDEGHGFRKRENRILASRTIRAFLDRYMTWEPEGE